MTCAAAGAAAVEEAVLEKRHQGGKIILFQEGEKPPVDQEIGVQARDEQEKDQNEYPVLGPEQSGVLPAQDHKRNQGYKQQGDQHNPVEEPEYGFQLHPLLL